MEIDKLKIDDDLVEYLSNRSDVNAFINECIRKKKLGERPSMFHSPTSTTVHTSNKLNKKAAALETDNPKIPGQSPMEHKEENNKNSVKIFLAVISGILLILIICIMATSGSSNKLGNSSVLTDLDSIARDTLQEGIDESSTPKSKVSKSLWNFRTEKDEMTNTKDIWASITSDNSVDQDEPYGETDCSITVRYMKKWGYDVMIGISEGQIFGSEYDGENYVMVKFDNGKPIKYWFNEASDGSSESVFINRKSDFIARCKKAKSIKVELPLYQGGRPVFDFSVDEPLKWKSK